MLELEALINQLDPSTVVELGVDDPVDASGADLDQPLDLIIYHASDDSERLRTAFEVLFPLITPGGMYVIVGAVPPAFILELMFCTIASGDVVAKVMTGHMWVAVDRGVEDVDGRHFRLADEYTDLFGVIR